MLHTVKNYLKNNNNNNSIKESDIIDIVNDSKLTFEDVVKALETLVERKELSVKQNDIGVKTYKVI